MRKNSSIHYLFCFLCFFCFLFLTGATATQQTFTFDEPIDALSVRLPHDDTSLMLRTDEGWHEFFIEKEFDPLLMESDLVTFDVPQHSVTLRGQIDGIELHPIRVSKEPAHYSLAATTYYRAPRILSRADWGADESFLFKGPDTARSDADASAVETDQRSVSAVQSSRVDDCTAAQKNYPQDFAVSKTVTHDAQGRRYRWAKRYMPSVKRLVVHHTAQKVSGDPRPAVERIRALYDYHANSRGWGDLGYHYLIDENGVIYEGRDGGDLVVGGQVYCGNVGTVGIAMLGNFDIEKPTLEQVQSLQWLLHELATKYDIDLNQPVSFKGKVTSPIVRHKDLISTDCPGYFMSSAIAQVRNNVANGNLLASVTFPNPPTVRTALTTLERTQQRLAERVASSRTTLPRSYYRAKRLVRTAQRVNPTESRIQAIQQQLDDSSANIQRLRAARQARLRRTSVRVQDAGVQESRDNSKWQMVNSNSENVIRLRLSYEGNVATVVSENQSVRLGIENNTCIAVTNYQLPITIDQPLRIGTLNSTFEIPSRNTHLNRFRGVLECRVISGELVLINELSLEDYMAGLAEQPDSEPFEKQKAFAVAARSYAAHYMQPQNRKFAGMPYDGDDSPARFQMYGGIVFEENNPQWVRAVRETEGIVVKKGDDIVKTAYFSSSDGRTRSPAENGWNNYPHADVFTSKPDPWCSGMKLRGHGVGMSGCGAEAQAEEGKSFVDILTYYYPGTALCNVEMQQCRNAED